MSIQTTTNAPERDPFPENESIQDVIRDLESGNFPDRIRAAFYRMESAKDAECTRLLHEQEQMIASSSQWAPVPPHVKNLSRHDILALLYTTNMKWRQADGQADRYHRRLEIATRALAEADKLASALHAKRNRGETTETGIALREYDRARCAMDMDENRVKDPADMA